jgi:hypothetical protein
VAKWSRWVSFPDPQKLGVLVNLVSRQKSRRMKTNDSRSFGQSRIFWPSVAEQATSVSGWQGSPSRFANFCAEVAYTAFKFFASYLSRFADETDRDLMHTALVMSGVVRAGDWRWSWAHVDGLHYSACPMYSLLQAKGPAAVPSEKGRRCPSPAARHWGHGNRSQATIRSREELVEAKTCNLTTPSWRALRL